MKCQTCGNPLEVTPGPGRWNMYCGQCDETRVYADGTGAYVEKAREIGELVERKQKEYGDSWGKAGRILEILYPDGVRPDQYHTFLGITRVIDKLCRLANGNQGEENAWEDLAGYGLLGAVGGERDVSSPVQEVRSGDGSGDENDEV